MPASRALRATGARHLPARKLGAWDIVAIVGLVVLGVSSCLGIWFGVYGNPIGTYSTYAAYTTLLLLVVMGIFVKPPSLPRVAAPPPAKQKTKLTQRTVSTGAGVVKMASD